LGLKLKHKIIREPLPVSLYRLIKDFDRHAVQLGQVLAQNDFLPAQQQNALFNSFDRDDG
jgi:DNA recombination-dependent growth factor C